MLSDVAIVTLTKFPDVFAQLDVSIDKYEPSWKHRIAVVDNDDPYISVPYQGMWWTFLAGKKPFSFARNWNIGLRAAPKDCDVLLVNDDVQFLQ